MSSLTDQLAELEAAAADARRARAAARDRVERGDLAASVEVLRDLKAYTDGVRYKQHDRDLDRQRELTAALFERIAADGLVIETVNGVNGTVYVRDPALVTDYEAAIAAANEASRALREFRDEHGDELEKEARDAEVKRFQNAVRRGDLPEVRRLLDSPASQTSKPRRKRVTTPA